MHARLERTRRFLDLALDLRARVLLVLAAALLVAVAFYPLWNLTMFAPQYPQGLRLDIYAFKLVGGNGGQDLKEINLLNHYIGMRDLAATDFTEFYWMPFVVGALALLTLRAAVHGRMEHLVDVIVLNGYFAAFSLWSFAHKLYLYGHELAPSAPVKVAPFMPPLFGGQQIANFEVYSYPSAASYALGAAMLLLVVAAALTTWGNRRVPRDMPAASLRQQQVPS
jgi:copper chaperone NosL